MRDFSISLIRVSAMIFIVLYHCLCFYGIWGFETSEDIIYGNIDVWKFFCTIALNVFVFISGFLFASLYRQGKYKDSKELIKGKYYRLLAPYLIWGVFLVVLFPSLSSLKYLISGIMHLWFLLMLFSIFCITAVLKDNIINTKILIGGGIMLIILNAFVARYCENLDNYFGWKLTLKYLPAFICGILTVVCNLTKKFLNLKPFHLTTLFLILSCTVFYISICPSLPLGNLYINFPVYVWIICLYCLISKSSYVPGKILSSLDRHSMCNPQNEMFGAFKTSCMFF